MRLISQSSRPRRALAVLAATALAAAALPAAAGAASQSLHSVALTPASSGYSMVLDVAGGSTSQGARVILWYFHGGSNQRWNFIPQGNGYEHIVNQNSGMCLTTDGYAGSQLYQMRCTTDWRQNWDSGISTMDNAATNRLYGWLGSNDRTIANPTTGLVIDVSGGGGAPGTAVDTWYPNRGNNQYFVYYQL
jgi:hypothetical protein